MLTPRGRHSSWLATTLIVAVVVASGCDRSAPPAEAEDGVAKQSKGPTPGWIPDGVLLYEQVSHTYPNHNTYSLDHQLLIRTEDTAKVMEMMAIEPGMTVADLGCGSGFYTFRFADAAGPKGKVIAIDIQQTSVDYISERVKDPELNPHGNVDVRLTKVDDCLIEANTLDRGLFIHADFYAYAGLLEENVRMIASVYRAMKPGGTLTIVQDTTVTEKASAEVIIKNFGAAGFVVDQQHPLDGNFDLYLRMRKPAP